MNYQPYEFEIETVIMHTLSVLDGVRIKRYKRNERGLISGVEKEIDVPIKYAPNSTTIHEIIQVNGKHSLPFMALKMGGLERNSNKIKAKDLPFEIKDVNVEGGYTKIYLPVPIKLDVTLDIISEFEEDLLQIFNNFVAYFNPYVYISWKEPFTGKELKTKLTWSGRNSFDFVEELGADQKQVFRSTTTFSVESFIFREKQENSPPIICFDLNWYSLSADQPFKNVDLTLSGDAGILYCATPCVRHATLPCLSAGNDQITVYGGNLDNVDAVFYTGDDVAQITDNYRDLFQYNSMLSASNPPFFGEELDFKILSEHALTVTSPSGVSELDLKLVSLQAGYTDVTESSYATCVTRFDRYAQNFEDGEDGASAYEIAVEGGFVGTSSEWLDSLQGADAGRDDQLSIDIDGAGGVITTGEKGYVRVPYDCVIQSSELVADQSGSIVIDIWKDTYSNFPPTVADSISITKPTLSSSIKSTDSTLTGWDTTLTKGDYLAFNVDSASTVTRATLSLGVLRS